MDNCTCTHINEWPWVSRLHCSCCSFFHCTTCAICMLCYHRCTPQMFQEHVPSHGPPISQGLLDWQTSTTPPPPLVAFCQLTPSLLEPQQYKGINNPLTFLTKNLQLHALTWDLVRTHKKNQLEQLFTSSAPTSLWQYLPSIMNWHTSEALLCMSHHFHYQHLCSTYSAWWHAATFTSQSTMAAAHDIVAVEIQSIAPAACHRLHPVPIFCTRSSWQP
jgi:hypothetical protein